MSRPIRFVHAYLESGQRYTVAYTFEKNDTTLSISYGIAQCSKNDSFSRVAGRHLAQARLETGLTRNHGSIYYGSFTAEDYEGLSVGRLVRDRFEAARKEALEASTRLWNAPAAPQAIL